MFILFFFFLIFSHHNININSIFRKNIYIDDNLIITISGRGIFCTMILLIKKTRQCHSVTRLLANVHKKNIILIYATMKLATKEMKHIQTICIFIEWNKFFNIYIYDPK